MNIAIDFDGTFTADEQLWRDFIAAAEAKGHRCYVVTCRSNSDEDRQDVFGVADVASVYRHTLITRTGLKMHRHVFTARSAKRWHMEQQGIKIDVWIDDEPKTVEQGK